MANSVGFDGFLLQASPAVYCAKVNGRWLLEGGRVTPSWRIDDPEHGWQRIVNEDRCKQIARLVLGDGRTFPNSIVLATDLERITTRTCKIYLPVDARFLVVDGQHRLYSHKYFDGDTEYSCVIHLGLDEVEMAKLFVEINNNQKRVPASLRWDLVRLIRPEGNQQDTRAVDIIYELVMERTDSPLYQRVDLTGENKELTLKQAGLVPEVRSLISRKDSPLFEAEGLQVDVLVHYLSALRGLDRDGWRKGKTPVLQSRVLRALLQLLPDVVQATEKDVASVREREFAEVLAPIDLEELIPDKIKAKQGTAGIVGIRKTIEEQIFE